MKLNTYQMWGCTDTHGWTDEERLAEVAKRDRVVFTEHWPDSVTPAAIKALNPQAKVYRWYTLMAALDWDSLAKRQYPLSSATIDAMDAWLRDADGRTVCEPTGNIRFIDIGHPGLAKLYTDEVLKRVAGKGFDGVGFDYIIPDFLREWPIEQFGYRWPVRGYLTNADWYARAFQPFLSTLSSALRAAGYKVLLNFEAQAGCGNEAADWTVAQGDAFILERFFVNYDGSWLSEAEIKRNILRLRSDPHELWVAESGVRRATPDFAVKRGVSHTLFDQARRTRLRGAGNRFWNYYGNGDVWPVSEAPHWLPEA